MRRKRDGKVDIAIGLGSAARTTAKQPNLTNPFVTLSPPDDQIATALIQVHQLIVPSAAIRSEFGRGFLGALETEIRRTFWQKLEQAQLARERLGYCRAA